MGVEKTDEATCETASSAEFLTPSSSPEEKRSFRARQFVARPRPGDVVDDDPNAVWLPRAEAAKALGLSKSGLNRREERGEIPTRLDPEKGLRLFRISAAAYRAIALERRRTKDGEASVAVVKAFLDGGNIDELCVKLQCPPQVIARALAALRQARSEFHALAREERAAYEAIRLYEIETGNPDIPTSWAWIDLRFKGVDGQAPATWIEARQQYTDWIEKGGEAQRVPHYVRDAIATSAGWLTARRLWAYERRTREELAARETTKLELETRTVAARCVSVEVSNEIKIQRETERRRRANDPNFSKPRKKTYTKKVRSEPDPDMNRSSDDASPPEEGGGH